LVSAIVRKNVWPSKGNRADLGIADCAGERQQEPTTNGTDDHVEAMSSSLGNSSHFPRQGRLEIGEHSGVATRPRDACNEAAADRIGGIDGQATPPCGVFADCTITAGGYDFREGQGLQMRRLTRRAPI